MAIKSGTWLDQASRGAALVFRPVVISGMVTCIAAAWVLALETMLREWRGGYLVPLVWLFTLETLLVERNLRLRRLALEQPRTLEVRLGEFGLMVVLVKTATYLYRGWEALARDILIWLRAPDEFLDADLIIGIVVAGTMWMLATGIAANISEIEDLDGISMEREAARHDLRTQFIGGAIAILCAVGAQRLLISPSGLAFRPVQLSGMALLPVAYLGLGLALFGQVRFSSLLAIWAREEVPIAPGMERRWAGWSLIFIAGVCLAVLLLPAGNTSLGLVLLVTIMAVLLFLGQLLALMLMLLLGLLLAPCLFLFRVQPGAEGGSPTLPDLGRLPPPTQPPDWLFAVQLVLLVIAAAAILLFIGRTYLGDRQAAGLVRTLWEIVRGWWNALLVWLFGRAVAVQTAFGRRLSKREGGSTAVSTGWWERWRARTARDRVRRLYLVLVQRAGSAGHPRRGTQTPYEYSADLSPHVPGAEDDLSELTQAFVQARYSRADFETEHVSYLHRLWRRVTAKLHEVKGSTRL